MKKILLVLACLMGVSCGKANLEFIAPGEGQVFDITSNQTFSAVDFTVSNNEFDGVSIEFRGTAAVNATVQCDNTSNSPYARCYYRQGTFNGAGGQNCSAQMPCEVTAILIKGGQIQSTRTVKFQRGTK